MLQMPCSARGTAISCAAFEARARASSGRQPYRKTVRRGSREAHTCGIKGRIGKPADERGGVKTTLPRGGQNDCEHRDTSTRSRAHLVLRLAHAGCADAVLGVGAQCLQDEREDVFVARKDVITQQDGYR